MSKPQLSFASCKEKYFEDRNLTYPDGEAPYLNRELEISEKLINSGYSESIWKSVYPFKNRAPLLNVHTREENIEFDQELKLFGWLMSVNRAALLKSNAVSEFKNIENDRDRLVNIAKNSEKIKREVNLLSDLTRPALYESKFSLDRDLSPFDSWQKVTIVEAIQEIEVVIEQEINLRNNQIQNVKEAVTKVGTASMKETIFMRVLNSGFVDLFCKPLYKTNAEVTNAILGADLTKEVVRDRLKKTKNLNHIGRYILE